MSHLETGDTSGKCRQAKKLVQPTTQRVQSQFVSVVYFYVINSVNIPEVPFVLSLLAGDNLQYQKRLDPLLFSVGSEHGEPFRSFEERGPFPEFKA